MTEASPIQLQAIFAGTDLDLSKRKVDLLVPARTESTAVLVHVSPDEAPRCLEIARDLLPKTGRWPVLLTLGQPRDAGFRLLADLEFSQPPAISPEDGLIRSSAASVLEHVSTSTFNKPEVLARWENLFEAEADSESIEGELEAMREKYGSAPTRTEIEAGALLRGHTLTGIRLDRMLLDWEIRRLGDEAGAHPVVEHGVPEPPSGDSILLLPTAHSWGTLAFLSEFATDERGTVVAHMHLLKEWEERYGAEIVAATNVTLDLTIETPPGTIIEAWELAREHHLAFVDTFARSGTSMRDYARHLLSAKSWSLFERP